VLVLDDLQWSDEPALRVVELLLRGDLPHLLVIGCVREDLPATPRDDVDVDSRCRPRRLAVAVLAPAGALRAALQRARPPRPCSCTSRR
jgi:hypothetical protein